MKNYNDMNVHELVVAIETLGEREGTPRDMPYPDSLPVLESLLRHKVIDEEIVHCFECVGGKEDTPESLQCALWCEGNENYCSGGTRDLNDWIAREWE